MSTPHRNIIVIGAGLHYRDKYHDVLEKRGDVILLLIDLQKNKESILQFFADKVVKPQEMLFLEEHFRNSITVEDIETLTLEYSTLSRADGVVLSTEPKVKAPYAIWAAKKGFPVFMDKPISAFYNQEEGCLLKDYNEIEKALQLSEARIVVSCERRAHFGYRWIKDYLSRFIQKYKVPITAIDIQYAGGVFNLPDEYPWIENHPFRYGYGVLLHSGYHYIDLLVNLLSLNKLIGLGGDGSSLEVMTAGPSDQIKGVGKENYSSLIKEEEIDAYYEGALQRCLTAYGETDVLLMGQVQAEGKNITNFSVRLFGTSLALRKTRERADDSRLPGRLRQEYVTIHLGHHCSIHIVSMPLHKLKSSEYEEEHFDIFVMNSPKICDADRIIKLDRKDLSSLFPELPEKASLNGYAGKWQLKEFLEGRDGNSSFTSHQNTVEFIDRIYSKIASKGYVNA